MAHLHYNPESGQFTWINPTAKWMEPGEMAGSVGHQGYVKIKFYGTEHSASRLANLYMTGRWPKEEMDHIDRNTSNNRWANLREASRAQNVRNRVLRNRTEHIGVGRSGEKYIARVTSNGVRKYLGTYTTALEAELAVSSARRVAHGEFSV